MGTKESKRKEGEREGRREKEGRERLTSIVKTKGLLCMKILCLGV